LVVQAHGEVGFVNPRRKIEMEANTLLTVEDAAAHLKISKHTLNRWRVTGEGPPFIKYGPRLVRYLVTALDIWANERMFANTSQYGR
jgi:predicted DNA-binding transcriptional regulator AlpA